MEAKNFNILIVDDDVDACTLLQDLLKDKGYSVDTAFDGWSGVDKMTYEKKYDLLILDLRMPEMDGSGVFRIMDQLDPDMPKIIVTGADYHDEFKQEVLDKGGFFMEKPIDINKLMDIIDKIPKK